MELTEAKSSDMPQIYSQMEKSFIRDEIRDYADALSVFENKKYTVYHLRENGVNVGFMCLWRLSGFSFLEHFVVYESFRGKGYGAQALDLLKNSCPILVLECEPPETPMQQRRMDFYKRHGMIVNEQDYWQPSYRPNGEKCYLKLMSSAMLPSFHDTVKELYKEVYQVDYE